MMNDDDDIITFADQIAARNLARKERIRALGLARQEQLRFDEEEQEAQQRREQKAQAEMQARQQKIQQPSPSQKFGLSFSKQLQRENQQSPLAHSGSSPIKSSMPSSPLRPRNLTPVSSPSKNMLDSSNNCSNKSSCKSPAKTLVDNSTNASTPAKSPLKNALSPAKHVFTPPRIDLRPTAVEFSPLLSEHKSPIRPVNFSPNLAVKQKSSVELSTFNQSPKPYSPVLSPMRSLIQPKTLFKESEPGEPNIDEGDTSQSEDLAKAPTHDTPEVVAEQRKFGCLEFKEESETPKPRVSPTKLQQQQVAESPKTDFAVMRKKLSERLGGSQKFTGSNKRKMDERSTGSPAFASSSVITPTTGLIQSQQMKSPSQTKSVGSIKAKARLFEHVTGSQRLVASQTPQPLPSAANRPPERLCVSDKKKLFESAIIRESEAAKRNKEQDMFLNRGKTSFTEWKRFEIQAKKFKQDENYTDEELADKKETPEEKMDVESEDDEAVTCSSAHFTQQNASKCQESASSLLSIPPAVSPLRSAAYPRLLKNNGEPDSNEKQSDYEETCSDEHDSQETDSNPDKNEITLCFQQMKNRLHQQLYGQPKSKSSLKQELEEAQPTISSSPKKHEVCPSSPISDEDSDTEPVKKTEEPIYATISFQSETPTKISTPSRKARENILNIKPLTPIRTLSMYRREQKVRAAQNITSNRRALIPDLNKQAAAAEIIHRNMQAAKERVADLRKQISQHEITRSQTGNAVTLCLKSDEFRGSSEHIEAERIFLIATHKQLACQAEIKRLTEKLNLPDNTVWLDNKSAIGTVIIQKIQIPLNTNFVLRQVAGEDLLNHYFICVARCNDKVFYSEMLCSTDDIQQTALIFVTELQFDDLDNNFEIQLETYGLALPRLKCQADRKNRRQAHKTEKKPKAIISSLGRSKSPSRHAKSKRTECEFSYSTHDGFTRIGYVTLSLKNLSKCRVLDLQDFMYNSPFDGQIHLACQRDAQYKLEARDYLNFYDDSGEYPVWNRRWCVLKGFHLAYWRFTEDENSKPSLGVIDLRRCVNPAVGPIGDAFARKNTFMLICLEQKEGASAGEQQQQMTTKKSVHTWILKKYQISTDLKEEQEAWCEHLNQVLENVRLWDSNCVQPYEQSHIDSLIKKC